MNAPWNFGGSFAFCKSFDAPNPVLDLEGLGDVGLPLGVRDAKAIREVARQAPFGKGERTVVDTTVRDTWEMDASQVSYMVSASLGLGALMSRDKQVTIQNPQWNKFMTNAVEEVCVALGINIAASKPRWELYKLLMYETGSQ